MLARNGDEDVGGWIQILVFVVIAVIYALGNLVKGRADKEDQRKEQLGRNRPRYKPLDKSKVPEKFSQQQRAVGRYTAGRESNPAPPIQWRQQPVQTAAERPMSRTAGPGRRIDLKVEMAESLRKKRILAAQRRGELGGKIKNIVVPEPGGQPVAEGVKKKFAKKQGGRAAEKVVADGPLIRLAGADDLRTAILYHEILGKPVGLREQSF